MPEEMCAGLRGWGPGKARWEKEGRHILGRLGCWKPRSVCQGQRWEGTFELGVGGAVGSQWEGMKLSAVVWAGAGHGLEKESMCVVDSQ